MTHQFVVFLYTYICAISLFCVTIDFLSHLFLNLKNLVIVTSLGVIFLCGTGWILDMIIPLEYVRFFPGYIEQIPFQ